MVINMNQQKRFDHSTPLTDYSVTLTLDGELRVHLAEKLGLDQWEASFGCEAVMEVTTKTGHNLALEDFWGLLVRAFEQKDISCYVDILSSQDLQSLKSKSQPQRAGKAPSKSNKRYLILTYMTNDQKYHYPLALTYKPRDYPVPQLKEIYQQLRVELQAARASALNDTAKSSDNSFSINYEGRRNARNSVKVKEVDQFKSENEILRAKLSRLQEQVDKKKVNLQIEAAIERTRQLKENIETANLQLVDWKNNLTDQEQKHADLKKELAHLHKKICALLTSQKEVTARKKGEEVEKELNQVRNLSKKQTAEVERLKAELENSKAKVKELELKAKKLNSQKEVLRKGGRRGPYSSAGSVRSYNSFGSSKKSYGSGASVSSKPRSNYSYNSYKLR